ncbi:RING-H2 finger protein ATL80 [Vitis vinifera]|uniref:RING-H2 finger protein ATL80 n=1 Tax=Vitis vinifera TaxID=29760 RepID=A0A438K3J5_VITVI|nr:RING-H2 finger protein ATL80 [Vitis vinifera]
MSVESESVETTFIIIHHRPMSFMEDKIPRRRELLGDRITGVRRRRLRLRRHPRRAPLRPNLRPRPRCSSSLRLAPRISGAANLPGGSAPQTPANKGLKKKILRSLPKVTYAAETAGNLTDCAICLTEFVGGDEIRVLPQCGHGFHVGCIDTWLGSHCSCPSCRQILVVARCQKCGGVPASSSSTGAETESRLKEREDDVNRFLP